MCARLKSCVALMVFLTAFHANTVPANPNPAQNSKPVAARPYRVLVIIGDQWDDPGSYAIDSPSRFESRSRQSRKDFLDVVTMLKIGGFRSTCCDWTSSAFRSTGS